MAKVYYTQAQDYAESYSRLKEILLPQIAERGGVEGKRIMLKPNLLAWRREDDIACVHPSVIVETARIFQESGAAEVAILENPAVQTAPAVLESMGILKTLQGMGVYCANFHDYRKIETDEKVRFHDLEIAAEYRNYDYICDFLFGRRT